MGRDSNQHAIVRTLTGEGATVAELHSVGGGVPDLLVGHCGIDVLVEIKLPLRSDLNNRQVAWHRKWRGRPPVVIRTTAQAVMLLRMLEAESLDARRTS